jgi:hypothetical protein
VGVNWPCGTHRHPSAPWRNSLKFKRSSFGVYRINRLPANRFDGKSDGKTFRRPVSDFYRQTRFEFAQKPTNSGVFRAPNGRAEQFIGFFVENDVDYARLIRCLRGFQQYATTQTPRVVAYRLPKFVRALRGFLSLAVTKVHIR